MTTSTSKINFIERNKLRIRELSNKAAPIKSSNNVTRALTQLNINGEQQIKKDLFNSNQKKNLAKSCFNKENKEPNSNGKPKFIS